VQNIILTLSDGREVIALTKAFIGEDDEIRLTRIRVTPPMELPEDIKFEEIEIDGTTTKETT
jgi:hypothetical protein